MRGVVIVILMVAMILLSMAVAGDSGPISPPGFEIINENS